MKARSNSIAPSSQRKQPQKTPLSSQKPSRPPSRPSSNMRSTVYKTATTTPHQTKPSTIKYTRPRRCMNCKKMIAGDAYVRINSIRMNISIAATDSVIRPHRR
jgi:hypothetical protein